MFAVMRSYCGVFAWIGRVGDFFMILKIVLIKYYKTKIDNLKNIENLKKYGKFKKYGV